MRRVPRIALIVIAAAGVAGGCGGDENDTAAPPATATTGSGGNSVSPATTQTTETQTTPAVTPTGRRVRVDMRRLAFEPARVRIRLGDTMKWENEDDVVHNVAGEGRATFRSEDFGRGGEYEFTPTAEGTIRYVCTIHPTSMRGTITVEDS
jgi:plastocyanin